MSTIRTPELQLAVGPLSNLLTAADKGIAEVDQGKLVIGASNSMCRLVKTDVESRIQRAKAIAIEAKVIDAEPSKQIAAA